MPSMAPNPVFFFAADASVSSLHATQQPGEQSVQKTRQQSDRLRKRLRKSANKSLKKGFPGIQSGKIKKFNGSGSDQPKLGRGENDQRAAEEQFQGAEMQRTE